MIIFQCEVTAAHDMLAANGYVQVLVVHMDICRRNNNDYLIVGVG